MASARKPYKPLAGYAKLKLAAEAIEATKTKEELVKVLAEHGPKTGYKAWTYLATGKMTAAQMAPDEAVVEAVKLSATDEEAARVICEEILVFYPSHPVAKQYAGK